MWLLSCRLKFILSLFACGLFMVVITSCMPSQQPDVSPLYEELDRTVDPESAAMEAFARAHLMSIDGDFVGSLEALDQAIEIDPDSAFLYISKAELHLHLGQMELAKRALEDALVRDPELIDAYLTLSEIQTAKGEHASAIASLTAAQGLQPEDQQITLHLALAYARNQDFSTAVVLLEQLIKDSPDNGAAYLALARIHLLSNLPLLSVDTYRALLQIDPENEQATIELGSLFLQLTQPEQAAQLYSSYLEMVPDSNRIRYQLVRLYLDQGNLDKALEQLSLIVENNPEDIDALHKIGLIQLQQQRPDLAEQAFREVLNLRPDGASYYSLGIALEDGEKWAEALTTFEQIDSTAEHFPDAVIHRAYLLPKFERRLDAIALLESQLSVLEPMPELYEYLASLYGKEQDWSKAKRTLDVALEQFPDNSSLLLRQALLLDLAGEPRAALDSAEKILVLEPNNAEALNFIAYSYAVQNIHLEKAETLVVKAIELSDAPHIRDTYGWVLYRMNKFDAALVELKLASAGLPDDPTIQEHLGGLYTALGRTEDALAAYQKALDSGESLDPDAVQLKIDALRGSQ